MTLSRSDQTELPIPQLAMPKAWLLAAPICLAILILLPIFFDETSSALIAAWSGTSTYNYCFLIIPISCWLAWERRDDLLATTPRPSVVGFALLAAAGVVWLFAELTSTLVVAELALVAMAQSIVVAILGIQPARILIFPLVYLLFIVPVGETFIPALQTITANSAVILLKLTGIPVRSQGLIIDLPNARWIVDEACAGLKFLVASVAVGALLNGMFLRSWSRRLVFMFLSIVVPIAANVFRAYIVVAISYFTDNAYAAGIDHILYGWVVFALVLLGMVAIAVAMREGDGDHYSSRLSARPVFRTPNVMSARRCITAALASLVLVTSFRAGAVSLESLAANTALPESLLLSVQGPWTMIATTDPSPPIFSGADRVWNQAYSDGAATIYLSVAYFAFERAGAEVANLGHRFASGTSMRKRGEHWQEADAATQIFHAKALTFGGRGERRLLWYWLWVDGRYTGSPYLAKLLQLKAKLLGGRNDAAIISISTDYSGPENLATTRLSQFAHDIEALEAATVSARTRQQNMFGLSP